MSNLRIAHDYTERVYAGLLGKAIGVRLGAPLENSFWSEESIRRFYGEIDSYVRDYTNFAADDDTNGVIYFTRALTEYGDEGRLTPHDVARSWLNYTAEGRGMFWWGGYGVSTEHTAYLNLRNGIPAPISGSAAKNGIALAEQIGGQIFIDGWGLLCPGDPELAAHYAGTAASVSHDGSGVHGARFVAACIATAFTENIPLMIVESGLKVIPEDCEYARAVRDVCEFHRVDPGDFRECFRFVRTEYGYHKYPGIVHIIPNAAVLALSLLYGGGSFARTVAIAVMCGWDTDCNAGNAGTILGVSTGLAGIEPKWRRPINDTLIGSSVMGSMNIVDIPTLAGQFAAMGRAIAEERWESTLIEAGPRFDFELPGSTHGFRVSNPGKYRMENTEKVSASGRRSLRVLLPDVKQGEAVRLFYKPFYRRADFDDERYRPSFSPQAVWGQTVKIRMMLDRGIGGDVYACCYARDAATGGLAKSSPMMIDSGSWTELSWAIPSEGVGAVDELGLELVCPGTAMFGILYIDAFEVAGKANYRIDFSRESNEWDGVTQFTFNGGRWTCEPEAGEMCAISVGKCESFTGPHYMRDVVYEATVTPKYGSSHNLNFRVQGSMRSYAAGFDGEGRVTVFKNDGNYQPIATAEYEWEHDTPYRFRVEARGGAIRVSIDGEPVLSCHDDNRPYLHGAVGFSMLSAGHARFRDVLIMEL